MARGGNSAQKRKTNLDPIYNDILVAKFINCLMKDGKKTVAQKVVYTALKKIQEQGKDPLGIFTNAIENVGPKVEVRAKRIGGAAYQVPTEVRGERRVSLAIRWILEAAKKRPTSEFRTFADKLSAELLDASNNAGAAIRKRDVVYRMADANKAFANFRW